MLERQLAIETAVVAATLALALAAVAATAPGALRGVGGAATVGAVVGAAIHLGFEYSGLNRAYCSDGHACTT